MTALAVPHPRPLDVDHARLALSPTRVLRAELLKLRTLRSTSYSLTALFVVLVGIGVLTSATAHPESVTRANAIGLTLGGSAFAVFLAAAFGAVAGAREHASGMIRTTVAAVPRRTGLVVTKAFALVALVLPVSLAGSVVAFEVGSATLRGRGLPAAQLGDPGALRAVVATAAYLTGLAVISLAVGILVRSTAGAVAAVLGAVLIAPSILGAVLPQRWGHVIEALPSQAGEAITATGHPHELLSPLAGAADLTAWVVLAVVVAAFALRHRDA
jgi:hypothetical protein